MTNVYVVIVEHNVVTAVRKETDAAGIVIPPTKLEVGTQLADNYKAFGCIDGRYYFENAQRARIFAELCLEFTKALVERRLDAVRALKADEPYHANDGSIAKPHGTA